MQSARYSRKQRPHSLFGSSLDHPSRKRMPSELFLCLP
jgi:hypothetical protein